MPVNQKGGSDRIQSLTAVILAPVAGIHSFENAEQRYFRIALWNGSL